MSADLVSAATLAYYCGIAAQASAKATLGCFTAFAHTDLRNDLAAITVPTLIIHGDSDAVFPYEASGPAPTGRSQAARRWSSRADHIP